jgi:tetratricopeptide (TPR) repeat protein
MNRPLLAILIFLVLNVNVSGQARGGGGATGGGTGGSTGGGSTGGRGSTGVPSYPSAPNPRFDGPDAIPRTLFIMGKVVVSDGSPLSDRAAIQSNCRGAVRTEAYTDAKGNFSFQLNNGTNRGLSEIGPASDSASTVNFPRTGRSGNSGDPRDCELSAVVSGYTSQIVDLRTKNLDIGNLDVGRVVVHRMGAAPGATISAKQVPESARKDYFKGLEEKQKGKMDSARDKFQKAVAEYPEYAEAWLELGRVQSAQNDPAAAKESFQKSIAAESNSLPAYQELAQIAAKGKQWQDLANITDQMLKIDSHTYPEFWFYNGVSKYYLGKVDEAQNSVTQGIKLDGAHRIPKMEYVLGVIMMQKGDNTSAAEHFHKFLALAPNSPEAADTQKKLEVVEKASVDPAAPKP